MGLSFSPFPIDSLNSSSLYATDPPEPPKVKEGLMMAGKAIVFNKSFPSSRDLIV